MTPTEEMNLDETQDNNISLRDHFTSMGSKSERNSAKFDLGTSSYNGKQSAAILFAPKEHKTHSHDVTDAKVTTNDSWTLVTLWQETKEDVNAGVSTYWTS